MGDDDEPSDPSLRARARRPWAPAAQRFAEFRMRRRRALRKGWQGMNAARCTRPLEAVPAVNAALAASEEPLDFAPSVPGERFADGVKDHRYEDGYHEPVVCEERPDDGRADEPRQAAAPAPDPERPPLSARLGARSRSMVVPSSRTRYRSTGPFCIVTTSRVPLPRSCQRASSENDASSRAAAMAASLTGLRG